MSPGQHDFGIPSSSGSTPCTTAQTSALSFESLLDACDKDYYPPLDHCPPQTTCALPTDSGSAVSEEFQFGWPVDAAQANMPNELAAVAMPPDPGYTALHVAVNIGDEAMVRLLLDKGADVTKQDGQGKTALCMAAERDHDKIASMLLESSTDPNKTDYLGRTALFAAVVNGSETIADLLLAHSARVNVRDQRGMTPLHLAVAAGSKSMTLFLIDKGANVDG